MKVFKTTMSIVLGLVVTSCTKEPTTLKLNPLLIDSQNIISTRPQNSKRFIAVLKLKNPSLMESAKRVDGKTVVDSALLESINKEQSELISTLKSLSPEIQILYRYKMVLNAVTVLAPNEFQEQIKGLGEITYSESSGNFSRPEVMQNLSSAISARSFK